MHSRRLLVGLAVAWFLIGVSGCQSISPPRWFRPGTSQVQRAEAHRFDPFPENEPGPEILGGRPRGYTDPPAEPSRARWQTWSRKWLPGSRN